MTARTTRAASPAPRARTRRSSTRSRPAATTSPRPRTTTADDERRHLLRLYVTGATAGSTRAIHAVRRACEERLHGRYDLEVIDLYKLPALAKHEQIIATPTLIRVLPAPLRRLIGDLTNVDKVLFGIDLQETR